MDGYILDGDLLQEVRTLAAGVAGDNALPPQPVAQPGQVAVAVEGVGQQVAGKTKAALREKLTCFHIIQTVCVCVCAHSQGGQGVQCVEGPGVHGGDLVVVQGQESH